MANIFLIVEGSTEEQFYKNELQKQYVLPDGSYRHFFNVVQMPTKKNIYSRGNKGGRVSYQVCVNNIRRFIRMSTHCQLVILILDYYGLDESFSDHLTTEYSSLDQRVEAIQARLESDIGELYFRFRLQVHEFEAYLYSDPQKVAGHFQKPEAQTQLEGVLAKFGNDPERINNHPKTAPSKRLEALFPEFGKTTDGLILARKISVPVIREKCTRFNQMCFLIDTL